MLRKASRHALHQVWCSLRALIMLKSPEGEKCFPQKSMVHKSCTSKFIFHGSRKNQKPVSQGRKNIDSRITEKINPHSCLTQRKKHPFTRHEKSMGDPLLPPLHQRLGSDTHRHSNFWSLPSIWLNICVTVQYLLPSLASISLHVHVQFVIFYHWSQTVPHKWCCWYDMNSVCLSQGNNAWVKI